MIASLRVDRTRPPFIKCLIISFLLFSNTLLTHAQEAVTGKVTSSTGDAVPGASVQVKGTNLGTSTDNNGNFSIVPPGANATLVISSLGFDEIEVSLEGRRSISVTLNPSSKQLDQVVVIGYGTANRRDLTGSIVKIEGREIADKPNTNPIASLQGKSPAYP